jgi:hypothetical protein
LKEDKSKSWAEFIELMIFETDNLDVDLETRLIYIKDIFKTSDYKKESVSFNKALKQFEAKLDDSEEEEEYDDDSTYHSSASASSESSIITSESASTETTVLDDAVDDDDDDDDDPVPELAI